MNNLKFLTSLKGIAAWWIVLFHIREHLLIYLPEIILKLINKGYIMVDLFFVISGFLISYNYLSILSNLNLHEIKNFYIKRIVRIYPLHFLILIAYIIIPVAYTICEKSYLGVKFKISYFISNLFLIHNWGVCNHLSWNVPSWAVSVEIAAYLLFPLIAFLIIKLKGQFTLSLLLSQCLIIYLIFSLLHKKSIGEAITKLGLIRGILEFIIGICICILFKKYKTSDKIKLLSFLLLIIGLSGIIGIIYFNLSDIIFTPISIATLLFSMLIHSKRMSILIGNKLFVLIGKMSYSTYIIHYFLRDLFKLLFLKSENTPVLWIISYCSFLMIASYIVFQFIETPIAIYARNKFIPLKTD